MQRGNTQVPLSKPKEKYEEYTAALSVFSDGLLNEAYRPLLEPPPPPSGTTTSSCENETNTAVSSDINPIYIEMYNKCKLAANVIQRYESIPGFLKSYNTLSSKRPGPRRAMSKNAALSQSMSGPTSGVNRSTFRPGGKLSSSQIKYPSTNSADSSVSSSARKRSLTPTLEVTTSGMATAPPQAAIKFLQKLNSSSARDESDKKKRKKHTLNSKDSSSEDKEFLNDQNDQTSSSGSEHEDVSGMTDTSTNNNITNKSIQKSPLSEEQPTMKLQDDSNMESKHHPENRQHEIGSMENTFDVGDDVLCYYESDQKWYECIVRNVHREVVHGASKTDNDPNTIINVSPKRLSRSKNKTQQQIVSIVGYDVEYDDGTGEEHVDPKRIKDRYVLSI